MMLEEVLRYIENRFDCDKSGTPYGTIYGEFSIEDGSLEIDGLLDGQYFWVEGSVLNDGLHLYPASDLADEHFKGAVVRLVVPKAVVEIADEIEDWCAKNAAAIDGPYQSESFGGYSYTKATASSDGNEMPAEAWKVHFGARLRPWRKLSRDWV